MHRAAIGVIVTGGLLAGAVGVLSADESLEKYIAGEKRSGYVFATPETRDMQDDDFNNPSFLWVDRGEALWSTVEGEAGKSCMSCHNEAADSMKGVGARYPVYYEPWSKPINLEQRINLCRKDNMKAEEWKWESDELLGMTAYVRMQSRGMPVNVSIDGPMKAFYDKGEAFYNERRGQLDMACKHCHEDNWGTMMRANLLTQGQSNGFPTYRLKWQKLGSLHRRFRGCNEQVRSTRFDYGADEYVNLEVFLGHRGNGLPVETPSVRN